MNGYRRSLLSLGLAVLLPVVLFVAVELLFALRNERREVEADTMARSKEVMLHVDQEVANSLVFVRLMATSTAMEADNFNELYLRAQRALRSTPHLAAMLLWDARTQREVFDTREPFDRLAPAAWPFARVPFYADQLVMGGIEKSGPQASPEVRLHYPVMRDGQVAYVVSVVLDAEVFQDILMTYSPDDIVGAIVDQSGNFIARTIHYKERFGTPATSYVRKAIAKSQQGFYAGKTYEGFDNYSAFYKSASTGWSAHLAVASAAINGSRQWSLLIAVMAAVGAVLLAGVLVALVLRDMEDRRRGEEVLRQSQKMEAVGQLTGGIAHDFNNLLTAMIGGLDIIVQRTAHDDRIHKFAVNALAAAHRGAKLTSQLLAFSRQQKMALISVDLRELIEGMNELLLRSIGPAIHLKTYVEEDARYVISDPTQLEFALLNLAANARDAMPSGGQFTIKTAPAEQQYVSGLPKGSYIQIEVSDSGVGMSEEVRRRALEPFFTTKSIGEGTGLGLAQVFGVIRQSNGAVHLASSPGAGTQVFLILPRAAAAVLSNAHSTQGLQPVQSIAASILVVDDDAQVRKVVVEALRTHGYRVAEAENGTRALSLLADSQPQLMLIDFAMPGANGAEVARKARQRYPQLKVLIMSGYADTAAVAAGIGAEPLLAKPFDTTKLLRAVAAALKASA